MEPTITEPIEMKPTTTEPTLTEPIKMEPTTTITDPTPDRSNNNGSKDNGSKPQYKE